MVELDLMQKFMEGGERFMPRKHSSSKAKHNISRRSRSGSRKGSLPPRYNQAADFDFSLPF